MSFTPRGTMAVLGTILWAMAGCGDDAPTQAAPASPQHQLLAEQPPALTTLTQVDLGALQRIIEQTAAQDRVLVIDFWATWCAPCIELFPALHTGLHQLPGVRPVTVTLDSPGDWEAKAIAFLQQHGATDDAFLLTPDSDAQIAAVRGLGRQWRDLVVPAILVYDRQGNLAGEFFEGATADDIIGLVKRLTAPSP